MRPPLAVAWGVRIARPVGVLVVHAMHGDPVGGASMQCHGATERHGVLQPLRRSETAMRELAVIADGDADVLAHKPERKEDNERRPMEAEQGCQCSQMKACDYDKEDPVEFVRLGLSQFST